MKTYLKYFEKSLPFLNLILGLIFTFITIYEVFDYLENVNFSFFDITIFVVEKRFIFYFIYFSILIISAILLFKNNRNGYILSIIIWSSFFLFIIKNLIKNISKIIYLEQNDFLLSFLFIVTILTILVLMLNKYFFEKYQLQKNDFFKIVVFVLLIFFVSFF